MPRITHHLNDEKTLLSDWLGRHGFSPEKTNLLISLGAVYVNKARCLENTVLNAGDYVRIHHEPKRFASSYPIRLVKEARDFIVIDKPSGLPTHPTLDNVKENVKAFLEEKLGCSLLAPQRLDIPTSGLLLFAKSRTFLEKFNGWMREGSLKKYYVAVCSHRGISPRLGKWTHFMEDSKRSPKILDRSEKPGWKLCLLELRSAEKTENFYRMDIQLMTGRTHQIRAQLAFEGFPVLGDRLYGSVFLANGRPAADVSVETDPPIALCCRRLAFPGESFSLSDDAIYNRFGHTL